VFVQGNGLLLDALAEAVVGASTQGSLARGGRALELYAGAGFLTLPLARRFAELRAVESNPAAVRDLRANLEAAGGCRVDLVQGRSERVLADLIRAGEHPEVVVLDPPRSGLESQTRRRLLELAPQRIVYLSCDPATLSRDLAVLCTDRYILLEIQGFDLFPQTFHVEAMAVLERGH
jgi:23S rRNA (uracil1939-C5)-methyltransferase